VRICDGPNRRDPNRTTGCHKALPAASGKPYDRLRQGAPGGQRQQQQSGLEGRRGEAVARTRGRLGQQVHEGERPVHRRREEEAADIRGEHRPIRGQSHVDERLVDAHGAERPQAEQRDAGSQQRDHACRASTRVLALRDARRAERQPAAERQRSHEVEAHASPAAP
jgi:hypothetical protein